MSFSKRALLIGWSTYTLKNKVSLSFLLFLLRNNTTLGTFTMQHKYTISRLPKSLVMVIIYNYWSSSPTVYCVKKDMQSFLHLCSGTPGNDRGSPEWHTLGQQRRGGPQKPLRLVMRRKRKDRRERSMWGNAERIWLIVIESRIFHYPSFLSRYYIKGEPRKVWRAVLQTFTENFFNTAALVKTFTENIHLKILKVKGVKTKISPRPYWKVEVRILLAQEKLCMQILNLRGPWNQNDQLCDAAENGNWQIQGGGRFKGLISAATFWTSMNKARPHMWMAGRAL